MIEQYYGLDNRPLDHDLVLCVKCGKESWEKPNREGDKYAWECRSCGTVHENGKEHLLSKHCNVMFDRRSPI